jgi:hypothetical protein
MPLAVITVHVTSGREGFTDGHFPLREPGGDTAKRHRMRARADGPAAGHQARAARVHCVSIFAFRIACPRRPVSRSGVPAPRVRPPPQAPTSPCRVVGQDEDDVGFVVAWAPVAVTIAIAATAVAATRSRSCEPHRSRSPAERCAANPAYGSVPSAVPRPVSRKPDAAASRRRAQR